MAGTSQTRGVGPNMDVFDGLRNFGDGLIHMQGFVQVIAESHELKWAKTGAMRPICATPEARRGHGRYEPKWRT